jgi:protocatechuate 3,4-dioxygenase beta subunit
MMDKHEPRWHTRREFLYAGLVLPTAFGLASYVNWTLCPATPEVFAQQQPLAPTPACGADPDPTPRQTEGPYYKRQSPERTSLREAGVTGIPLVLTGYVLSRTCQPVARTLLDFWQADNGGHYDNKGYRLRGHQFTDDAGRYRLDTVLAGLYPGRTRHIHVKLQAPHRAILTTQLYFPGEPRNATDHIFDPNLLLTVEESTDSKTASFNFILDIT